MLFVYTYRRPPPPNTINLSTIPLDQLSSNIEDIVSHQKHAQIWFGYLDGWMLTPHEEVILRKAIRKFDCHVVSAFPLAFSQSWKNEIHSVYTIQPHGDANTHDNGSFVYNGGEVGYGGFGS